MNAPLNPGAKSAPVAIDGGPAMKTLPALAPTAPQLGDDQMVPEELVGRLYRASGGGVADVVAGLSLSQHANLAMFFYRKSHLHQIGRHRGDLRSSESRAGLGRRARPSPVRKKNI